MARELKAMARDVSKLDLDALVEPIAPDGRGRARAVSELERSLNQMRLQLLEDTRALRLAAHEANAERDAANQANEAKTRFLANVSHELRIPQQSVSGYGSLRAETP
ncbi:MAG: hybrid sensor histidine kinase/response regulator, partial [Marinobacter sp.]